MTTIMSSIAHCSATSSPIRWIDFLPFLVAILGRRLFNRTWNALQEASSDRNATKSAKFTIKVMLFSLHHQVAKEAGFGH